MTPPRFSIRALVFTVLFLAADCAALRLVLQLSGSELGLVFAFFGSLPMAHVLAVAFYRLATRPDSRRPFLIGFEVAGLATVLGWFNVCLSADRLPLFRLNQWLNGIAARSPLVHGRLSSTSSAVEAAAFLGSYIFVLAVLTSLPQLLCALLGGWLARRLAASLGPTALQEPEPVARGPVG